MLLSILISILFVKSPRLGHPYQRNDWSKISLKSVNTSGKEDAILGKWMTTENNLEVEVYKKDNNYLAKIIWFQLDDHLRPINTVLDEKNPDPKLRTRKWLGMEVLRKLKYNADENEWEGGIIYDAKHGKEWNSIVWINSQGLLKVKGYWLFRWISQTLTFKKVE